MLSLLLIDYLFANSALNTGCCMWDDENACNALEVHIYLATGPTAGDALIVWTPPTVKKTCLLTAFTL